MSEQPKSFTARLASLVHALFLTVAILHAALACIQPLLAGWSLDADGTALDLHGTNGSFILTLSMVLFGLGILWWRPGRGTIWAPLLVVALFAAETFQLGMGYADILVIHLPLGVGIVVASVYLCVLAARRPARGVRAVAAATAAAGKDLA
ncbi:hypothetical protein [Jiangella gansuensis]|uniref:hypothetical protein n=1 Tax=Jiangella gansuensis TaxID=281473 RepID=UPI0004BC291B|nr:hypothetical protein [Jiangella gansuensis]